VPSTRRRQGLVSRGGVQARASPGGSTCRSRRRAIGIRAGPRRTVLSRGLSPQVVSVRPETTVDRGGKNEVDQSGATGRRLTMRSEILVFMSVDWDLFFEISVHPTHVEILSAMEWIDEPLSPAALTKVLERYRKGVGHLVYHLRRLDEHGLVRLSATRSVRGSTEHFYVLVEP
jgi:hypothetical protein